MIGVCRYLAGARPPQARFASASDDSTDSRLMLCRTPDLNPQFDSLRSLEKFPR
jgi:hypothetical protein